MERLIMSPKSLSFLTKTALAILLSRSVVVAGPDLYRLNSGSGFQFGCFYPPCLCPIMAPTPVSGAFLLTLNGSTNQFRTYSITDIHWKFSFNGTTNVVTGRGKYNVGAGQQELSADLQMNRGKTEHFDSGLVTNPVAFPNIKVSISTNLTGQHCVNAFFHINASPIPVPQLQVQPGSSNELVLSWAVSSNAFVLQENPDPTGTDWTEVTNTPNVTAQQNYVVLARSSGCNFYRLWPGEN
jgi:hypothetical protein